MFCTISANKSGTLTSLPLTTLRTIEIRRVGRLLLLTTSKLLSVDCPNLTTLTSTSSEVYISCFLLTSLKSDGVIWNT